MNWDTVKGNWKEWKGKAQQKWGELTDDELQQADGKREELVGLVQQRYGKTKEEAEKEVDDWFDNAS
ncbi:MAG: CsbD family protein [Rhodobacteraceae bacterium]|nr:CsbD family protein [Paracoccaceae bacterium]